MKTGKKSTFLYAFRASFRKNRLIFANKKAEFKQNFQNLFSKAYAASQSNTKAGFNYEFNASKLAFSKRPALSSSIIVLVSFFFGLCVGKFAMPVNYTHAEMSPIDLANEQPHSLAEQITPETAQTFAELSTVRSVAASKTTSQTATTQAEPKNSQISALDLYIPGIVNTSVSYTTRNLPDPDYGPLQYKNLIYGHRATVFYSLPSATPGTIITVRGKQYRVNSMSASYQKVDAYHVANWTMPDLWNYNGIVIMTCDKGNSARWLIFADPIE